jgi:hypothetical protein
MRTGADSTRFIRPAAETVECHSAAPWEAPDQPAVTLPSAGWSSLVARRAHNPKVAGSNPAPATKRKARSLWPGLSCRVLLIKN